MNRFASLQRIQEKLNYRRNLPPGLQNTLGLNPKPKKRKPEMVANKSKQRQKDKYNFHNKGPTETINGIHQLLEYRIHIEHRI